MHYRVENQIQIVEVLLVWIVCAEIHVKKYKKNYDANNC